MMYLTYFISIFCLIYSFYILVNIFPILISEFSLFFSLFYCDVFDVFCLYFYLFLRNLLISIFPCFTIFPRPYVDFKCISDSEAIFFPSNKGTNLNFIKGGQEYRLNCKSKSKKKPHSRFYECVEKQELDCPARAETDHTNPTNPKFVRLTVQHNHEPEPCRIYAKHVCILFSFRFD